jgi:hypothetical protein
VIERRAVVVHTRLAGHMARVAAARAGTCGTRILTMDQLAARLAGGFLQPIDPEALHEAVSAALAETELGELEPIKPLPGMARAAVDTFSKVWRAGIDLHSRSEKPRLKSLALLEQVVLLRLPPSMLPPAQLVERALERLQHAPAVLGPVEVHGHSEMPPCWRWLLLALAGILPVTWVAGPRSVPDWLRDTKVQVQTAQPAAPDKALLSCANPQHEAIEALRWARSLMAAGTARPEEIAIAAASPAELDDHMLALRRETNLPVHFVHGVKAVSDRDGQGCGGARRNSRQRLVTGARTKALPLAPRPVAGPCGVANGLAPLLAGGRDADDPRAVGTGLSKQPRRLAPGLRSIRSNPRDTDVGLARSGGRRRGRR